MTTIGPRMARLAAVAGLAAALAWPAMTVADTAAAVGKPAPAFRVADSNGKPVALADFSGKTVVVEWTNPECPYVRKHYDSANMQRLQGEARSAGAVWLTVLSVEPGKMGYSDSLEANAWVDAQKAAPTAFLMDADGAIANRYGVTVALSMFVIDPAGKVVYSGAIDDKPTANPADIQGARNYVRDALAAVAQGTAMKPSATRPYGCNAR